MKCDSVYSPHPLPASPTSLPSQGSLGTEERQQTSFPERDRLLHSGPSLNRKRNPLVRTLETCSRDPVTQRQQQLADEHKAFVDVWKDGLHISENSGEGCAGLDILT